MRVLRPACSREAAVELYAPEQGLRTSRKNPNNKSQLWLYFIKLLFPPFGKCSRFTGAVVPGIQSWATTWPLWLADVGISIRDAIWAEVAVLWQQESLHVSRKNSVELSSAPMSFGLCFRQAAMDPISDRVLSPAATFSLLLVQQTMPWNITNPPMCVYSCGLVSGFPCAPKFLSREVCILLQIVFHTLP